MATLLFPRLGPVGTAFTTTAFSAVLLAVLAPVAAGAGDPTPTIEQSINLKSASGVRIAPDGRYVAYQVHEANWADNAFKSEVWVAVKATEISVYRA